MKIDLHVHSRFSTRPSQWVLQKIGCPESYTEPQLIVDRAKARGMDMVTICDHNTIEGALSIAHLPDTFVSLEATSYFPEDGCKVHVLTFDITEAQFAEIQKIRENIYDLVAYLQAEGLTHVCAHPLFGVNDRLTVPHVEKILLLFKNLELSGSRDGFPNQVIEVLARSLTPADIERLANRHGIEPAFAEPWKKNLTGGSDDHSSVNITRFHTEVPGAASLEEFLDGLNNGRAIPRGIEATPTTMAHNLYAIAYQYYKNKLGLSRYVNQDIFLSFTDRFLGSGDCEPAGVVDRLKSYWTARRYASAADKKNEGPVQELVRGEAARLILSDPVLSDIAKNGRRLPERPGEAWFRFATGVSDKVLACFAESIVGKLLSGNIFDVFQVAGSAGALYTVLAPYFVAYSLFSQDRRFGRRVLETLCPGKMKKPGMKLAHFTDTFREVNGVALTLRNNLSEAVKCDKPLEVFTCYPEDEDTQGVVNFNPIATYNLPEYGEFLINFPPFLPMLAKVFEGDYTLVHAATPGPMGLASLLIARILKLPVHATYHTQVPQYVGRLTGDDQLEDLAWKFILWFYEQAETVFAPSLATAKELEERGLSRAKIVVYPRGVDTSLFHPAKRNGFLSRYKIRDSFTLLYVGRVSKEKNLELLARTYRDIHSQNKNVRLVIAGDGPYTEELKGELKNTGAVFAGYVHGEELAELYASCDLFVFPSATDTFGNVVLEAQASGLPVVVTDQGGPCENVAHGETGLIVDAEDDEAFKQAVTTLASNPALARKMGAAARKAMEGRSFAQAFNSAWECYEQAS